MSIEGTWRNTWLDIICWWFWFIYSSNSREGLYLLSSVDDVLCECEAVDAGSAWHRVVTWWRVGHFHGTELKEGLPESYTAEQQLPGAREKKNTLHTLLRATFNSANMLSEMPEVSPLTHVTWPVLVKRTPSATSYTIHILVTLGGVLGEVDPSPEHASYVGVSLVETFVDDGVDEWRTYRIKDKLWSIWAHNWLTSF